MCHTPEGCPIQDLAEDEYINKFVDDYMMAKSLYRATEDPVVARHIFEDLGLVDDPEFHLQLENIYAEWMRREMNKRKKVWDAKNAARSS
jgi:hypothetical protein